jgi:hypothetical protein
LEREERPDLWASWSIRAPRSAVGNTAAMVAAVPAGLGGGMEIVIETATATGP